jgi:glutamyl-tRNA reductase
MISVEELKIRAEENLKARTKEVEVCLKIIDHQIREYNTSEKERELERKMSIVPQSIKGIREKAFAEIFVKEIKNLDPEARVVLDTLVDYMEKKIYQRTNENS